MKHLQNTEVDNAEKPCSHYFEYSHKEVEQVDYTGAAAITLDVTICRLCGFIKRETRNY